MIISDSDCKTDAGRLQQMACVHLPACVIKIKVLNPSLRSEQFIIAAAGRP